MKVEPPHNGKVSCQTKPLVFFLRLKHPLAFFCTCPAQWVHSHWRLFSSSCQSSVLLYRVNRSSSQLFPPWALWVPVVSGSLFQFKPHSFDTSFLPPSILRAGPCVWTELCAAAKSRSTPNLESSALVHAPFLLLGNLYASLSANFPRKKPALTRITGCDDLRAGTHRLSGNAKSNQPLVRGRSAADSWAVDSFPLLACPFP